MACLGLLLGMIGIDNMTGHFRYSFDLAELGDGIGIVPVAVGLFGLGEILSTPSAGAVKDIISPRFRDLLPTRKEWNEARHADRARHGAGIHYRHHSRLGARNFQLSFLRDRTPHLEASRAIRQGRGRRRGRTGNGEQCRLDRRLRAAARARHPDQPDHRRADRRADDSRRFGRPDARQRAPQRVLGLRRLDVRRQPHAAGAQPAAGERVRDACCAFPTPTSIR